MDNNIRNLLNQLYTELALVNSPLLTLLNNGISREEVNNELSSLAISLPEEVYVLYEWRNGTKELYERPSGELLLCSIGTLYSIVDAVAEYNQNVEADEYWKKDMFPILASGGGEYLLFDNTIGSPNRGKIHYYSYYGVMDLCGKPIITYYDSLESLLKTTIECYQQKAYHYNASDPMMLEIDFDLEKKIAKKYNPVAEYWKLV